MAQGSYPAAGRLKSSQADPNLFTEIQDARRLVQIPPFSWNQPGASPLGVSSQAATHRMPRVCP